MTGQSSFKTRQLQFNRVRLAYDQVWPELRSGLQKTGVDGAFEMFIRAFKAEGKLELWLRSAGQQKFKLFRTYNFCAHSGNPGPKIKEGDLQTPEGFYYINVFNPESLFHLSLGINYPNATDLKRSAGQSPGGDIYIHGNCVTVGCIPLTDEKIREVYVLAVEAKACGQNEIPVYIFPFRMNGPNLEEYSNKWPAWKNFWNSLVPAYRYFEERRMLL
ncbi:murein L,D-transpeptidase family protein [Pedobacter sp. SYP-B3415]|uniref:L,D-transpeptidase family protein n=1 Tax=Pedobacter sp. SYP-B3415 TaxID=2496641 RepID=UPI00101C6B0E|nr:L,D-transpeptidase family protein [Pedobacter sp. SYP-B3415]